ncbi:EAL domain-containing protein [Pseudoalteromonas rubra]|uniref:EAL domain-containing protein n=1 Tax=Pseudoalteromonas rubra TaxID=43658 RepID=A0A5S3UU03_9GAMM|nr:sensor domain-containing phosphodiesterase [Pseudoalteromonas rubra]QPB82997.1 EAL domain-containing protein [Pseudoalteromonas rubra]
MKNQLSQLLHIAYLSYDRQGQIISISDAAERMLGLKPGDILSQKLVFIDEDFNELNLSEILFDPIFDQIELGVSIDNSSVTWVRLYSFRQDDQYYIRLEPVEELISVRRLNKQLAIRDPHTGLLYRDAFINKIKEQPHQGTICCVRICNFQRISEVWNIGVANLVFMEILARFQGEFDKGIFSKHSSDCYCVFIPDTVPLNIETLYKQLNEPFNFNGNSFYSNVSLGYYKEQPNDDHELSLNKAEMATFDALSDHNRLVEFKETLARQIERQNKIETGLRSALYQDNLADSFEVVFQPIHDTKTERLIGAECLMRWELDGQPIPPTEFIPIIESTGEINKLTLFTLSQINKLKSLLAQEHIEARQFRFAINISVVEILDVNFTTRLLQTLEKLSLNPAKIKLELTESALIDNFNYINEILQKLQSEGLMISIDDFGTGYSSLSYLCKLHFDEIKIDRAFVTNVVNDGKMQSLFNSIVSLAKNLDKPLVAEGIEQLDQMIYAKAKGVEYIQGYYYSKPLSINDFVEYVVADKSSYLHFEE